MVQVAPADPPDVSGKLERWRKLWSEWEESPERATQLRCESEALLGEIASRDCLDGEEAASRLEIVLLLTTGYRVGEDVPDNNLERLMVSVISYLRA